MKRIEIREHGAEDVLQLVDAGSVAEPGPGQVTVEIHAAGVNPADTHVRAGNYEFLKPDLPFAPGYDGAGVVSATGTGVTHVQKGSRVWVSTIPARTLGTYAQTMVCDAGIVHPLPDHLSFEEGAALGVPYTTAYRALFQRGHGSPGEVVLVHGASGGVGIPAVQISPRSLMVAEADVRGTALWNMTPAEFEEAYAALDSVLRSQTIRPVIGKQFPLAEAAEAHRFITTSRALGKVVLRVR
ncbi:alcohol dehydrogenase catalytic domain-containing protein [Arthrobacter sp. ISL-5]|uniref:alcohol dehydrogenase catalytic domain-containing protein n=1 Tax=Arthrobacter sp. ISL-5 TaxID=2819111 RepID=UPI001BEC9B05|nr:zinc-binding dehydrogenase [Arthrobacter sp. ISL-5]MBT2551641.1 zinc-binding dehydrogenase [Arthrobacter sp. ISL-5]